MTIHPELSARLQAHIPFARAQLQTLPASPDIQLYLLNADYPQQSLTQEQMLAVMNYPAYWAFCWASGQVLARFIAEQPQWVRGRRVLDFGCGSGVVAIAAARAGAAVVYACDIDPDALLATAANAAHNGVELVLCDDYFSIAEPVDLIIVADVLYDRENLPWLDRFLQRAEEVLVADSRIRDFSRPGYEWLATHDSTTLPDLDELEEFRWVRIYRGRRLPVRPPGAD